MKLKDVKFLKMSRSDYENSSVAGIPVQNFPAWHEWMKKNYINGGLVGIEKISKVTADNRVKFKKHFGKCAFTFNGGHYFHGWLVDLGTTEVIILTAKEHGTCYEVVNWKDGVAVNTDIPRVLEFMDIVAELPG